MERKVLIAAGVAGMVGGGYLLRGSAGELAGRVDIAPVTCCSGTDSHSAGFCCGARLLLSLARSVSRTSPPLPDAGVNHNRSNKRGHPTAALAAVSLGPTLSPPLSRPHNGHFCVRRALSSPAVPANTYAGKKTSPTTRTPPTARPTRRRCTPSTSSRTTAARARCSSTSVAGRAS